MGNSKKHSKNGSNVGSSIHCHGCAFSLADDALGMGRIQMLAHESTHVRPASEVAKAALESAHTAGEAAKKHMERFKGSPKPKRDGDGDDAEGIEYLSEFLVAARNLPEGKSKISGTRLRAKTPNVRADFDLRQRGA